MNALVKSLMLLYQITLSHKDYCLITLSRLCHLHPKHYWRLVSVLMVTLLPKPLIILVGYGSLSPKLTWALPCALNNLPWSTSYNISNNLDNPFQNSSPFFAVTLLRLQPILGLPLPMLVISLLTCFPVFFSSTMLIPSIFLVKRIALSRIFLMLLLMNLLLNFSNM